MAGDGGHGHHAHRQAGRTGVPSGHPRHSFSQDSQEPQEAALLQFAPEDPTAVGVGYFLYGQMIGKMGERPQGRSAPEGASHTPEVPATLGGTNASHIAEVIQ